MTAGGWTLVGSNGAVSRESSCIAPVRAGACAAGWLNVCCVGGADEGACCFVGLTSHASSSKPFVLCFVEVEVVAAGVSGGRSTVDR